MNERANELNDHPRGVALKLALRVRAVVRRRAHALEEALIAFDSSALKHVRDEDRFAQALEEAETAEGLADAIALHAADIEEWAAEGMSMLRAIRRADEVYERELGEALDRYRNSVTGSTENSDNDERAR
jgi:hypothetical protein